MRILVTGSAGFVGENLVPLLLAAGHQVLGVDLLYESHSTQSVTADIRSKFKSSFESFDLCIHLASQVGGIVHNHEHQGLEGYEISLLNAVHHLCHKFNCSKIIYTSSINVFENNALFHHQSLATQDQTTPYAVAKYCGEKFVEQNFDNFLILRPTNLFGRTQIQRFDSKVGESHVIPELIHKIQTQNLVKVLGDGTQVRNFLHVIDFCKLILKLLDFDIASTLSVRSNLTISIYQLVEYLACFCKKNPKIEFEPSYLKYEKATIQNFDLSPLINLGWTPQIEGIQEGLLI